MKLFEAFAGVGSQAMALGNIGIDFKSVGISEIDKNAIISNASIHTNFNEIWSHYNYPTKEIMVDDLRTINAPLHHKTFEFIGHKLKEEDLKKTWLACKLTRNYGDVSKIDTNRLMNIDLFTYSFPCQDISMAGKMKGFEEGSGTKSSLLYECKKIIEGKRPKMLLLENVKNLVGKKFKPDFDVWIQYLESIGYKSYWKVINAKECNIPQNRERVFVVSMLEDNGFEFEEKVELKKFLRDILDEEVDEKYFINKPFTLVDKPNSNVVAECYEENFDQNKRVYGIDGAFQCLGAAERGTNKILVDDDTRIRRLTPIECWRLMGFSDEDFDKASMHTSNSQLYKQAGNSIVVPVLEGIFRNMLFGSNIKLYEATMKKKILNKIKLIKLV